MRRYSTFARGAATVCVFVTIAALIGGCPATTPSDPITVKLVNQTTLDVRPAFYASASATDEAGLFVGANVVTNFTNRTFPELRGGETISLTYDCDELLAIGSDRPTLFDATQLTVARSDDRVFAFQGTDFACGATVRVVYSTEGAAFHVQVEVE